MHLGNEPLRNTYLISTFSFDCSKKAQFLLQHYLLSVIAKPENHQETSWTTICIYSFNLTQFFSRFSICSWKLFSFEFCFRSFFIAKKNPKSNLRWLSISFDSAWLCFCFDENKSHFNRRTNNNCHKSPNNGTFNLNMSRLLLFFFRRLMTLTWSFLN